MIKFLNTFRIKPYSLMFNKINSLHVKISVSVGSTVADVNFTTSAYYSEEEQKTQQSGTKMTFVNC